MSEETPIPGDDTPVRGGRTPHSGGEQRGRDGFGGDVWAPPESGPAAGEREVPLPDTVTGDLPDRDTDPDFGDPLARTLVHGVPPLDDTLVGGPGDVEDLRADAGAGRSGTPGDGGVPGPRDAAPGAGDSTDPPPAGTAPPRDVDLGERDPWAPPAGGGRGAGGSRGPADDSGRASRTGPAPANPWSAPDPAAAARWSAPAPGAAPPPGAPGPASPVPPPPVSPDGPGAVQFGYAPHAAGPPPYGQGHPPPYGHPHPYGRGHPQPYGQPGYPYQGPPGYGYAHPGRPGPGWPSIPPPPGNGLGTTSLVLGIIAAVGFVLWPLAIVLGVLSLIFGSIGRQKAARGEANNGGQALAGIICGSAGLALAVLLMFLVIGNRV
ncbi:hypothetical protein DSC45_30405 [Streptomyces sp. YIM 130001]|uniref:DUF4190 domain-containing protein n=1 Tax=Streptomyces sp. YIM 130001 TaxID=2259644 RepID=UPI000EE66E16|nr:DUF4190 domain-containing protein [Streptomyces sp. YIM 130001]RII09613.1 hypothetical protein DSC45_30405 [Streptomyces sp. YIM 130001]